MRQVESDPLVPRNAVCGGTTAAWPLLGGITLDWLRNRLGVCIDDFRTAGTLVNRSVTEVIRRLMRVRNLIASNVITYVCNSPECDQYTWVYVIVVGSPGHLGFGFGGPGALRIVRPIFWPQNSVRLKGQPGDVEVKALARRFPIQQEGHHVHLGE